MSKKAFFTISLLLSFSFPFLFKSLNIVSASTFYPERQLTYFEGKYSSYCVYDYQNDCYNYIENNYNNIAFVNNKLYIDLDFDTISYDVYSGTWAFFFLDEDFLSSIKSVEIYFSTNLGGITFRDFSNISGNIKPMYYSNFDRGLSGYFLYLPSRASNQIIYGLHFIIQFTDDMPYSYTTSDILNYTGFFTSNNEAFNPFSTGEFFYNFSLKDHNEMMWSFIGSNYNKGYKEGYNKGVSDTLASFEGSESDSWQRGYEYGQEVALRDIETIKADEYEKGRQFGYLQGQNASNNQVNALKGVIPSFLGAIFAPVYEILRTPILGTSILEILLSFASISIIILFLRIFI